MPTQIPRPLHSRKSSNHWREGGREGGGREEGGRKGGREGGRETATVLELYVNVHVVPTKNSFEGQAYIKQTDYSRPLPLPLSLPLPPPSHTCTLTRHFPYQSLSHASLPPSLQHTLTWSHQHSPKLGSWHSRVYSISSNPTLRMFRMNTSRTISACGGGGGRRW